MQRTGRFAPSPTGPLHAGSLVAALASRLDALAGGGRWLVRIEDLDRPREVPGAATAIVDALHAHGFRPDAPIVRQSARQHLYRAALDRLVADGRVFACGCSRREVEEAGAASRGDVDGPIYPGTCREGLANGRVPRAWRMRVGPDPIFVHDRAMGTVRQNLETDVGDFVVRRADGLWAYQLAMVVDDADQGVTDVVRGADLLDSTPRQRWLQQALGLPSPTTLHVPLVLDIDGAKLAKSHGALPLDLSRPLTALLDAARHLSLPIEEVSTVDAFWNRATAAWAARWPRPVDR